ncbi:MAG: hypothetical protein WEB58_04045 [Planctomycetaceae bacterium]
MRDREPARASYKHSSSSENIGDIINHLRFAVASRGTADAIDHICYN